MLFGEKVENNLILVELHARMVASEKKSFIERKEAIHLESNLKFVNEKNEVMEGLIGVLKKLYSEVGADREIKIIGENTIEESGRKWRFEEVNEEDIQ